MFIEPSERDHPIQNQVDISYPYCPLSASFESYGILWMCRALFVRPWVTAATKLRSFDSYKLWVGSVSFASNCLRSVDLHRADSLLCLNLWVGRCGFTPGWTLG